MPRQGDVHVIRGNSGGWQVRVEGTDRARSIHGTQAEAAKAAAPTIPTINLRINAPFLSI